MGDLEFNAVGVIRPFYQIASILCLTGRFGNEGECEQFDDSADLSSGHVQYAVHPAEDTVVITTAAAVPEHAVADARYRPRHDRWMRRRPTMLLRA